MFTQAERPLRFVPLPAIAGLLLFFCLQVAYHSFNTQHATRIEELSTPPDSQQLSLMGLSDNIFSAKIFMLWLQAFDNQPGISIPFKDLNYPKVIEWLSMIQSLDENASYPLLAASRIYSKVPDDDKKRLMLDFVQQQYLKDPNHRWRWMAHCVYVAKYELEDLQLALEYARLLRENTEHSVAPSWATQMELFILEDLDQLESAKILIGGFLESGEIVDERELNFLYQRLDELEEKMAEQKTP